MDARMEKWIDEDDRQIYTNPNRWMDEWIQMNLPFASPVFLELHGLC